VGYRGVPRRSRQHCYQFIDRSDGALFGPGRAGDTTAAAAAGDGEATRAPHPLADCRDLPHLHVKGYAMIDDRDVRLVELVRAWPGHLPPRAVGVGSGEEMTALGSPRSERETSESLVGTSF
jgi:hypothetical protein